MASGPTCGLRCEAQPYANQIPLVHAFLDALEGELLSDTSFVYITDTQCDLDK